ncbi:MAG: glycosyltransferase [Armatimonadetes bacterium]|nr:glycosyltransferase [Armatimonadota bacterium]
MIILYNAAGYKPAYNIGGPIHTVSAVAERLAARGHRVIVAATDSNLTERLDVDTGMWHDVDGVEVRYFRMSDSWTKRIPLDYFRKSNADYRTPDLRPWIDACGIRFDVIHSQLPFIHANRVCSEFAERNGVPYFYSQHGVFDTVRLRHRGLKKRLYLALWELPACRRATALIALTEHDAETYRALGLNDRIEVIPNGIDLPEEKSAPWPYPNFPVRDGRPLVLFMSRLHPLKGPDLALEAFRIARAAARDALLVIAGPDEYQMAAKLSARVREAGLEGGVLIPGPVTGAAKSALLQRCNVFILPTESEGFSMAILEAMAHGCAVLTTHGAHFPELEDAGAGSLCAREPDALGCRLAALLADPNLTEEMGRRARWLVEERFSWDSITDRLESLYMECAQLAAETA